MSVTRTWKVWGMDGHRQRTSFMPSMSWNQSKGDDINIVDIQCADKTGTNDYVIITITRNTAELCERDLWAQVSDGVFENSRIGKVEEIKA